MTASSRRALGILIVGGLVAVVVLLLANANLRPREGVPSNEQGIVVVRSDRATPPVTAPRTPAPTPALADAAPMAPPADVMRKIRAAIGDERVDLRNVTMVGSSGKIACGERGAVTTGVARKFVWLAEAGLVATDDGGPDFARFARLCDGASPTDPAGSTG